MKRNYYYGTLQKFVHALYENDIQPFLMDYDELVDFFKEKESMRWLLLAI